MEIQGKIIAALPSRSGVSQRGSQWQVNTYVLETQERYPKKIAFDVFGADRAQQFNIRVGEEIIVSFDIDAREYQGKWFNSIQAWKVERPGAAQAVQPSPQPDPFAPKPQQPSVPSTQQTDNLPF